MPHANVWVRKGDWEKWEQLENKSQFLHDALNSGFQVPKSSIPVTIDEIKKKTGTNYPVTPDKKPSSTYCKKHGMDNAFCKLMKH